jgi:hypothetical protein
VFVIDVAVAIVVLVVDVAVAVPAFTDVPEDNCWSADLFEELLWVEDKEAEYEAAEPTGTVAAKGETDADAVCPECSGCDKDD